MKQNQEDLELLERQRKYYETQRYGYETQFNEDTAKSLTKAVHGSYYTNPEITASIGLSGVPIDPREVHINSQRQMTQDAQAPRNGAYVRSNPETLDPEDVPTPFTIVDLLRIPEQDRMRYRSAPKWWDQVDPEGRWRNLPVPTEITDAKQMLNLQQAQVMKLFLSKSEEEWNAIPGMIGESTYDSNGKRIPGRFDAFADLSAKFPELGKLWLARTIAKEGPEPWSPESISKGVLDAFQEATRKAITGVQLPFKILGFFAPDHIGPAGGVDVAGYNIPLRLSIKEVGETARAGIRTALVPLVAAGQASKSTLEQMLSQSGGLSPLDLGLSTNPATQLIQYARIFTDDEKRNNYFKSVIEGNILTQIANQAVSEGRVDLGAGFFPEGEVARVAKEKHDSGLPKIAGRTWTFGNAAIEPLIQEEWIDRDGYAATLFSGILDAGFTIAADVSAYVDPVSAVITKFNLGRVAATSALKGRMADLVYDAWAAERKAAGLPTAPLEIIDLPGYMARAEGEELPRFAGMLPEGSVLPDEAEAIAQQAAQEIIDNSKSLVAMDNPPPVLWEPNDIVARKERLGVITRDDAPPMLEPMAIDAMPFTADGQMTLKKLSSFNNVGELWDSFLGEIPPGLAMRIQAAVDNAKVLGNEVDLKEIHTILKEGVLSGDPYYNIREVPGVMRQWVQQTGKKVASYTQDKTRQFAMMPNVTFFSFADPIASVRDMNRIMVLMKVGKVARHKMLSDAIEAVASGRIDQRFSLQRKWMKTVLQPALSKAGVPDEWIEEVAKWEGWTNEITQWSVDAVGQGYPATWFTDNTADVIRSTDMIPKGFMMINPDNLKQAIRDTTNLWRAVAPIRAKSPRLNAALQKDIFASLEKLQQNWMKPAILCAPLPIRMVTRILPDELLRVAVTPNLDETALKALAAMGHVNYTTFGVEIKNAKEIQKLVPILEELDILYKRRTAAKNAQNVDEVNRVTRLIEGIESSKGTRADIQKQINVFNDRIDTALPGTGRNVTELARGLMGEEMSSPANLTYMLQERRTQRMEFTINPVTGRRNINPDVEANQNWVTGTARDIVQMSETPEYVEVAKAMLAGGPNAVVALPARFLGGDLSDVFNKVYEKILKSQGLNAMNPNNPITSMQGNAAWVNTIYNDILTRTAGDRVAIGAIVTKKLGQTPISKLDAWKTKTSRTVNVYEPSREWAKWVSDNLLTNPNSPEVVPFAATVATEKILQKDRLFTKAFSIYRNTSAKYARGPYQAYHKWQRIRELIPAMDPDEAAKMIAALDKSDAPDWLVDSLLDELPRAAGQATRKQAELLGEMHGHRMVDELLYNSENKSYFGSRHSLLFGFLDAWKEQWSVWGRQMATSPTTMARARLAAEGLKGVQLPSVAGGVATNNLMFKDEESGDYVFAIPFSRQFYEMIGLNAEERIKTKNLTLLGSPVPGFFGFGAMTMDSVIPKTAAFDWLRSGGFAYGDPEARSKVADYFVAPWGQAVVAGVTGLIGEKRSTDIVKNIQAIMSTDTNDSILASLTNSIWTNQAQKWDGIPMTADERERFLESSATKAAVVSVIVRGLSKIFLPGASFTKYFEETGTGSVTSGQMMDELRAFTNQALEEGKSYGEGVSAFLDKYGDSAWVYLSGSTRSLPGMQPTKEYYQWELRNGGLLDKYPLVAGYMGPQDGEYDPKAYSAQRARGQRSPKDIAVRQQEALEDVAWSVYNTTAGDLIANGKRQGYTEEQIRNSEDFQARMKKQSEALKNSYPTWDPKVSGALREQTWDNQRQQIESMIQDAEVLSTESGKALKEYWDYRTRNVEKAISINPELANESWRSNRNGAGLRTKLREKAAEVVEQYPEFASLWERVLSREYD